MADAETEELSLKLTTAIFEIMKGNNPTRATTALTMAVVPLCRESLLRNSTVRRPLAC